MNYQSAEALNQSIATTLRNLGEVVARLPALDEIAPKILARASQVEADMFTLLVVGSFNRGKSTLLNAMMGLDVLPQEIIPSTAVVTAIRFAETPKVVVHFVDGRQPETMSIAQFKENYVLSVDEIANDAGLSDTEKARKASDRFSHVDYANVFCPLELVRNRIELVDSPGTEDDRARTERARDFVGKADAIVYLLDSGQPVTEPDLEHLRWITRQGKTDIFFVANKWDVAERMARGDAEKLGKVTARFREKLAEFTSAGGRDRFEQRFFRISALNALEARETRPVDMAKLMASGIPALEQALERFLTHDRVAVRNAAVLADGQNYVDSVQETIDRELALLRQGLEQLERARVEIEPRLERMRGIIRHISEYLTTRVDVIHGKIVDSLRMQLAAIDTRAEVEKLNMSELTDGSLTWKVLQDRTADEENKLAKKMERQIEPQLRALIARERDAWERDSVSITMRDESQKLRAYLEKEAQLYRQALHEIDQILGTETSEPVQVHQLIDRWLEDTILSKTKVDGVGVGDLKIELNLALILGSLLIEIMLHTKAAMLTLGGTVFFSAIFAMWRKARIVNNAKEDLADQLQRALLSIPTPAQTAEAKAKLQKFFEDLRHQVTANMNAEVAQIEKNLAAAIDEHKRGEIDAVARTAELESIRSAAAGELRKLETICSGI
ncbi:dynamin family protein [Prosthecobacter sp.]|uniref:dynamin family protein n=1 Tax=Prosthecobacter sp. TaxID=1965333 RepID=UPI0037852D1E